MLRRKRLLETACPVALDWDVSDAHLTFSVTGLAICRRPMAGASDLAMAACLLDHPVRVRGLVALRHGDELFAVLGAVDPVVPEPTPDDVYPLGRTDRLIRREPSGAFDEDAEAFLMGLLGVPVRSVERGNVEGPWAPGGLP